MTSDKALYSFFSSFGIPAYEASAVPDNVALPYLTYDNMLAGFSEQVGLTVNLWYYTDSEAVPNAKAKEIFDALGKGGKLVSTDNGSLWIKRGSPFCQNVTDEEHDKIKRRYINITVEYLTSE